MNPRTFKYFVIVATMRSGSNMLERTLVQFDEISGYGELYNPSFVGDPYQKSGLEITPEERGQAPEKLLSIIQENAGDTIAGFRIFPDHNDQMLDFCLRDKTCAKIVLTRNPLESFVSLQLAEDNDRWQMRDITLRQEASYALDQEEFERYLEGSAKFYGDVHAVLQETGQTAFRIDYEDLGELRKVNGLARFLGVGSKLNNFKFRGSKQNPGNLADKIENYADVMAALHPIKRLDDRVFEYLEPRTRKSNEDIHFAKNMPLAYLPTKPREIDPIIPWLKSIDPKGEKPSNGLNKKEIKAWLSEENIKFTFTDLEHPVDRAYRSFCEFFVTPNRGRYAGIRKLLISHYELDLLPNSYNGPVDKEGLERVGYSLKKHRANFKKFLKFLKATLRDQALYQPKPEFCSQLERLRSYEDLAHPQYIALPHTRHLVLPMITKLLGVDGKELPEPECIHYPFSLDDVYDYSIEALTRKAYARDYQNFGFVDYTLSPK